MISPTRRAIALCALGFLLALLPALVSPRLFGLWVSYAALLAFAFGMDLILSLPPGRLKIEVEVPERLSVGALGSVAIRMAARRLPGFIEVLLDLEREFDPVAPQRLSPSAEGRIEASLPLRARRRGKHRVLSLFCRYPGPLGLVSRRVHLSIDREVAVVPDLSPVRATALRYFSANALTQGVQVEKFVGDGSEFDALKEYVPGLDPRAISWKASARHRRLLCQEFRAERNHQVVLCIDTGHLMAEPLLGLSRLDHSISSALLLAYVSLKLGDRVGLFGFDRAARVYSPPQGGVAAFQRLETASAQLAYTTEETNFTLCLTELSLRLKRRSLVVVFTEFQDTVTAELMLENLERLARRQLVVFVALRDPLLDGILRAMPERLSSLYRSVTAADLVRDRERVLSRLKKMGVLCVDAAPGELSTKLVNRYLDVKRRELIS